MAQRKSTKGTKQLGAEVATELVDEFKAFCSRRGETVRYHLEMAMRRHLDNPPPPPTLPPLPPVTASAPSLPGMGESAARSVEGKGAKKKGGKR